MAPSTATGRLAWSRRVVGRAFAEVFGQWRLDNFTLQEALYVGKVAYVGLGDEGDGYTVALGTGRTSDAVYVVLGIAWDVIVDDAEDVVNVDASGHNVCGYQDADLSGLEAVHDVVALGLCEVRVHGGTVDVHALQFTGDVFYLVLLAGEDDDAFQFAGLEQRTDDAELLWLVADIG